jgi:molybdate transport system ATP-binding protein
MNPTRSIAVAFKGRLGRFTLDAEFTVPASGVTGLFGPSGSGKTTVLRCIAGLQRFADGYCAIDGEVWQDKSAFRPVHKRAVGYVFQEASLFPHLSVTGNLLYATRGRRPAMPTDAIGFDEAVALLGLSPLLDRAPDRLSGGERQRVAIGRALLSQPKLLLMDEPLSALDAETKSEILPFLERLRDRLSVPIIYISHDMREIERLAQYLVLMQSGRVRAAGHLSQLQSDPALPLAGKQDAAVTLDAVVTGYDAAYGLAQLSVEGGQFVAPMATPEIGIHQRLTIAARDVSLAHEPPRATTILNILPCRIMSTNPANGNEMVVVLGLGTDGSGVRLLAHITRRSWDQIGLSEEMLVYSQIKSMALLPS